MKNRISTIKYIAKENNLSIPKILDIMAENDKYGSETTIRKVLEDGSEGIRFRYNTIEDIYESLLIKFGEDFAADDIDALKHIIREKRTIIYGLKREVALYEELKTIYERLIDGMEKQIIVSTYGAVFQSVVQLIYFICKPLSKQCVLICLRFPERCHVYSIL